MANQEEAVEELVERLVIDLNTRPLCAPLQQSILDIPKLRLNIASPNLAEVYDGLIRSMARRARDIAPALYCNKAITPFPNPHNRPAKTSASPSTSQKKDKGKKGKQAVEEHDYDDVTKWGHSYFIIELYFKDEATGKDYDGMLLQLMICDNNGYFVGFRRCVYEKWSGWYYCSDDFTLPFFLQRDATKLRMEGDHTVRPLIGGAVTFEKIFKNLGFFPDKRDLKEMEKSFLAAVLVFCEARRIIWVFMEVKRRISRNEKERDLDCTIPGKEIDKDYAWKDTKDWGVDSNLVLTAAATGVYTYTPPSAVSVKATAMEVGVKRKRFENLIAQGMERGHVGLIMREDSVVAPKGGELLRRLKNGKHRLGAWDSHSVNQASVKHERANWTSDHKLQDLPLLVAAAEARAGEARRSRGTRIR
ncbi:hypothetical protein ACQ4PT_070813 [Festuca glaucescens]